MIAFQPGQRTARVLQVSALYMTGTTAPLAEAYAAQMAASAEETVASRGRPRAPPFPTSREDFDISDIAPLLDQMRQEYFHAGIDVAGGFR